MYVYIHIMFFARKWCTYMYIYTYIYTCIHIRVDNKVWHTHTYIHTYIYIYIHTYVVYQFIGKSIRVCTCNSYQCWTLKRRTRTEIIRCLCHIYVTHVVTGMRRFAKMGVPPKKIMHFKRFFLSVIDIINQSFRTMDIINQSSIHYRYY